MQLGQTVVARYTGRRWKINANNTCVLSSTVPEKHGHVPSLGVSEVEAVAHLWHGLFGHVDSKHIRKLFTNQMGLGLPTIMKHGSFVCKDCLICKSTQHRILGLSEQNLGLLYMIVSDIMGPFPQDVNGA